MDWSLAHGLKVAFDLTFQRARQGNLLRREGAFFKKRNALFTFVSFTLLNKYCAKKCFAPFFNNCLPLSCTKCT